MCNETHWSSICPVCHNDVLLEGYLLLSKPIRGFRHLHDKTQTLKKHYTLATVAAKAPKNCILGSWQLTTPIMKVGFELVQIESMGSQLAGPPRKRRVMMTATKTTTKPPSYPKHGRHHFRRHHRHRPHRFRPRFRPRYGQRSLPWKSQKNAEVMWQLQLVEK